MSVLAVAEHQLLRLRAVLLDGCSRPRKVHRRRWVLRNRVLPEREVVLGQRDLPTSGLPRQLAGGGGHVLPNGHGGVLRRRDQPGRTAPLLRDIVGCAPIDEELEARNVGEREARRTRLGGDASPEIEHDVVRLGDAGDEGRELLLVLAGLVELDLGMATLAREGQVVLARRAMHHRPTTDTDNRVAT